MRAGAPHVSSHEHLGRIRPDARLRRSRRARSRRNALEWLESRTLLAVLPAAQVAGDLLDISPSAGSMSSPLVVVDRHNPLHLASVWVRNDPDLAPGNVTVVQGAYSNDGGATWTTFSVAPGPQVDQAVAPPASGPRVTYTQTINPQAAFDNNGQLYILTQQTNGAGTSGALILRKFDFSGNTPQTPSDKVVHQYVQDPVFNPTLTVDDNLETFTDPLTGDVQTDPHAGNVWISWSTREAAPTGAFVRDGLVWNPNSIQVIGSSDGGNTFTGAMLVGTGGSANSARGRYTGPNGTFAHATPKIAVSQGRAGGPDGGEATVIWDNFGIANATFDRIQAATISGGATAVQVNGMGGPIAQNPGGANPNGVATDFSINVSITDPNFDLLSKLTVSMTIQQANMEHLRAYLTAPDGRQALLFSNAMNAGGTIPDGQTRGIVGANLGIVGMSGNPASPYGLLGATFNTDAARSINDRGIGQGRAGTFRPEQSDQPFGGYVDLTAFNGMTAEQLSGTWTLTIVDYRDNGTNPAPQLRDWSLNFASGVNVGSTTNVATTNVRGSQTGSYARGSAAAGPQGIGPGIQIAQDNTLGSFSQHQGRIYVTYVGWIDYRNGGYVNPADNTDVFLVTSDDGGQTWTNRGIVNDDDALADGFSGGNHMTSDPVTGLPRGQIAGRAQFLPTVAVDQSTGTLVMSWRDGRDDSARARSSVYVTSSIDGGQSFSSQIYANPAQTSTDAVTGQQIIVAPRGDGFNAVNQPTPTLGFGSQMGLAVASGQVFTAWAGNLNASYLDDDVVVHGRPFQTYVQRLTIAAGPRVVESTMGVVGLPGDTVNTQRGPDGGPMAHAFVVTFDRPIDPQEVIDAGQASFTTADALVYYHDTVNGSAFIPLRIVSVEPDVSSAVGDLGYTRFRVEFDPTTRPDGTASGLTNNFVGTYSYIVLPTITDQVRTVVAGATRLGNEVDQNADAIAGQNPLTTVYVGLTPGDAYVAPMPAPKTARAFGPDPLSLLAPPFNSKTLPLIVPGAHLAGTSVPGGTGPDNLLVDGTTSSFLLTFDRDMNASSFTADKVLQIMGPSGAILGPQYFASNAMGELIPMPPSPGATSLLSSKLSVPGFGGTFIAANVTVRLNIDFPVDAGLTAVLVAPDGTRLTLFSQVGGLGSNFTNTVFSDSASQSITAGSAPFTGTFRPSGVGGLSVFNGKSIEGDWKLEITNTRGGTAGVLRDWSLSVTPVISVTPVNPVNGLTRTFSVNFPRQSLSGTYTVQVASNILDANGQALDANLNAGLDVLRGEAASVPTTTVSYGSGPVNQSLSGGQIASRINVPDNFPIQGVTASGRSGLRLRLNLSANNVAPLTATLIYHPDSPGAHSLVLFSGLVQGPSGGGFVDTLFDDAATTPISQGAPPFFAGPYAPKNPFLTVPGGPDQGGFLGLLSGGTWELVIESSGGGNATLNSWSLIFEKPLPTSGLGQPVADMTGGSFRIFQMNPTDPLSRSEWTAVGPAPFLNIAGDGTSAGRIGAMAQDPSDPTGNTFYVAGASGGIWKTNNFLTTDPQGPTYIPLTDFGPSNGMNIGGITVFPRNNDPNQSIIIASTGEGDSGSPGVGFLISKDGGATWSLFDSATNVDASGDPLPYNSPLRDRTFVGSTSFKVVVDPTATFQGEVIIYAAISGRNGGLWRSLDTGDHWQLMRAGNATDVVLDPSSNTGGDGNLQVVIAAFQGDGVYLSPNRGQIWNLMAGGVGNPLIVDTLNNRNVGVGNLGASPNGAHGRIALAKPALTASPVQNQIYSGWLYAAVSDAGGNLFGVFMTKDFGQNWVKIRIPTEPTVGGFTPAMPSNNIGLGDYNVTNGAGNFDITLDIDPTNPNIIYLGGYHAWATGSGMIRIDATKVWDAHNFTFHSAVSGDGATDYNSTGAITVGSYADGPYGLLGSLSQNYLNLIRDPFDPFNANSTILTRNLNQFANNGFGAEWIPFDIPLPPPIPGDPYLNAPPSYHRLVTMIDPTTGLTRLVYGTNRGVWSVLDDKGVQLTEASVGSTPTPGGDRNGNLQIAQFFYGAAQPSNVAVAASYDQALFYAGGNDGGPSSGDLVVVDGQLAWTSTGEGYVGGGVATNQQGDGTRYQAFVPGSMPTNLGTTFFRVDHVGRTFGLFQQSGGSNTPDPQWGGGVGATFAVNPVNGDQIIISSNTGRIFATENRGATWFEIGAPSVFGNPGNFSQALAYGAPDPGAPSGVGNLGNFMYVGTATGQAYITRTAGGGAGASWFNISLGLDGSPVKQIITNPARGSHSAYAVTTTGVFFIRDSVALAQNPDVPALGWVNVTGNLRELSYAIFGQTYDPTANPGGIGLDQSLSLATIAVDWRYSIPNADGDPAGSGLHPVLYVGGDSGVFRSLDNGATWTAFPDQSIDGSLAQGGHLPRVSVRDLDLSLGNINTATGMPNLAGPHDPTAPSAADPNLLLATTYGRGQFAIKMAPLILPGSAGINPADTTGRGPDGSILVDTSRFRVQGLSMTTGFGNATRITIFDATDNKIIGGFDPAKPETNVAANWTDAFGNFSVAVNAGAIPANGPRVIQIYATDDSGAIGNALTFSIVLNADDIGEHLVPEDPSLAFYGPDNTSLVPPTIYTNTPTPRFVGTTSAGATVELLYQNGAGDYVPFGSPVVTTADGLGNFTLTFPNVGVSQGTFAVKARAYNSFGPADNPSPPIAFTIKLNGPAAPPTLALDQYYDSGIKGDNITDVRTPFFVGSIGAANAGSIIRIYVAAANGSPTGQPLAQTFANSQGEFSVQLPLALSNGEIRLVATAVDPAGNPAPGQSPVLTTTIVSVGLSYSGDPIDYYRDHGLTPLPPAPVASRAQGALYYRNPATGLGQWFVKAAPPLNVPFWAPNGIALGAMNDIPVTGDFDGDGKADLAAFNQSTATWVVHQSSRGSATFQFGAPGVSVPVVGNFDGPGVTQFGVYYVNADGVGVWSVTSSATGVRQYGFGRAGDIPLVGDFGGVGKDQMAIYRPSTGEFRVFMPAEGGQPASSIIVATMAPNQIPVPGQYDNLYYFANGLPYRTEPAVYNPATGVFTIARPAGSLFPSQVTFRPGDVPVPADYNGSGWDQPGVYRPSTAEFLIKLNQRDPGGAGADVRIAAFPGLLGGSVVPPGAPLSYKLPTAAALKAGEGGPTSPTGPGSPGGGASPLASAPTEPAPASTPAPPSAAPLPTPAAPPAPVVVAPSLHYVSANPPGVARPWFAGTAAPGTTVDLFLSGSGVIGSRRVGTATADAAGAFGFQLPAGAKNGSYTLVAQARGADGSSTPIAGTSFNIGPAPVARAPRTPTRFAPIARAPIPAPRLSGPAAAPIVRAPVAPVSRPPLPVRRFAVAGSAAGNPADRPAGLIRDAMRRG